MIPYDRRELTWELQKLPEEEEKRTTWEEIFKLLMEALK